MEARYTKSGDINIAYGVAGTGDPDVVFVPGFVSHVELAWTEPPFGPICRRLSSLGRLVHFDKRGTGMSDRTPIATLEERMDDVRAVMDAAGVERAALVGLSEGGPMSLLFAATYPERVSSLVLWASNACFRPADDDVLDEIERFLTGEVRAGPDDVDRVLETVLFTDIVDSTRRAVELGDRRWRALLDEHDAATAEEVRRFRGEVVKTTGDGVLAVFDGPARAIRAAIAVRDRTRRLGVAIRAGLHSGECEVRGDDIGGIAVHTGSRIASLAGAGEIVVSSTVRDLVAGSGLQFADRGRHELKGIPGSWELLTVVS